MNGVEITTDDLMDRFADLLEVITPGAGSEFQAQWATIRTGIYHQCGLALAATSGADTEYDYYSDPTLCDCGTCTAIRGELGPGWRLS